MIHKITSITEGVVDIIKELRFFDSNVWLGRPVGFPLSKKFEVEDIGIACKKHHITGSLISHWMGQSASAQDGNEALSKITEKLSDNDYLIWTALPLYPEDSGKIVGCCELDAKVKAVRIFPKTHGFALKIWQLDSLCDFLIERSMPMFIQHTELDWNDIYNFARENPKLQIIVESQSKKILYHTRPLFALMKDCPNVLLEISNFVGPGFIEYTVEQFGPERLVYGSFMPLNDPFVPMGMIVYSPISKNAKKLIAGDNMRKLISGAQR